MARERMVTRTINATTYVVLTVDVTTTSVYRQEFTLTGEILTDDKALKNLKSAYETDTLKLVAIESKTTTEEIYGMLETEFLKVATKMTADRHFISEEGEQNNE